MAKSWVTVEPSLDPLIAPVYPIIETVDSILSAVITILNIVQAILNVIKAFLVGFLDPLRSIVEAIITELRNLIADLRQMGVYLTGDWELITPENNYGDLLGGYQAYERRMLGRLLDRTDPNRPNFTSSTTVLGVFLYTSSGDITEVIRVVTAILKFFGQPQLGKKIRAYSAPTAPELTYGAGSAGESSFRKLGQTTIDLVPDSLSVSWSMPSGAGGMSNVFSPAPKGFLIHVSTIRDGFMVVSRTPKDLETSTVDAPLPMVVSGAVDPATNTPLRLYGGIADIAASDSDSTDFSEVELDDPRAPLLLLQVDQNTPLIKPSLLENGLIPLIANTYFVKTTGPLRGGPGTKYTAILARGQLPQHATFSADSDGWAQIEGELVDAETFYVRVRALTEDYVTAVELDDATLSEPSSVYGMTEVRPYKFSAGLLRQARTGVLLPEPPGPPVADQLSANSFTQASGSATATFPSAVQMQYIEAVKAAILVAVLCRADLTESASATFHTNVCAPGQGLHGLEGAGRDLIAHFGISPLWFKQNRPALFRQKLRWLMGRVASELQAKGAPPDSVAEAIVALAEPMLNFTWSDLGGNPGFGAYSLMASIGDGAASTAFPPEDEGIGANPYCRSEAKKQLDGWYLNGYGPVRSPAFMEKTVTATGVSKWIPGSGSADYSPIIYVDPSAEASSTSMRVEYIRNALMAYNEGEVVSAAAEVLQLAGAMVSRPQGDTQWLAVRLMPQGLQPLDQLLERLDRFMAGILDGLDGITEKIVAYINAIQARIYQLQALLEQVRALLRALEFFLLPAVSGLVLVESGTDGLTTALVTSENKPATSSGDYGAGVLIVAGGIPTLLLESIALVLGGE